MQILKTGEEISTVNAGIFSYDRGTKTFKTNIRNIPEWNNHIPTKFKVFNPKTGGEKEFFFMENYRKNNGWWFSSRSEKGYFLLFIERDIYL